MHITPKVAEALRAFEVSTTGELTRCCGGYRPAAYPPNDRVRITTRTLRAMDRAWLVKPIGPFASAYELTSKGREALVLVQDGAPNSRAG